VYGHERMQRKDDHKALARSMGVPNVDDGGPADLTAVASSGEAAVSHNPTLPSRPILPVKGPKRGKKKSDSKATSLADEVAGMREEKPSTTSGSAASGTVTGPSGPAVTHASGGNPAEEVDMVDSAPEASQEPLASGIAAPADVNGSETATPLAVPPSNGLKWDMTGEDVYDLMTEELIPKVIEELRVAVNGSISPDDNSRIGALELKMKTRAQDDLFSFFEDVFFAFPPQCADWVARFFYGISEPKGELVGAARLPTHYGLDEVKRRVLATITAVLDNHSVVLPLVPSGLFNGYNQPEVIT
jgi:hypothetical protein